MPYRIVRGGSKNPAPDGVVSRSFWPFWGRKYACGHRDALRFSVRVRGAIIAPKLHDARRCADCVIDWIVTRILDCPTCEQPLYPGDVIQPFQEMPHGAIAREDLGSMHFSCIRMGCGIAPNPNALWRWDGEHLLPPEAAHP